MSATDPLSRTLLVWRTVRHLPPTQCIAWLRRYLFRRRRPSLPTPSHSGRSARWPKIGEASRSWPVPTVPDGRVVPVLDESFRFLDVERQLPEIDWTAEYVSPLWTYHLHYFDYAVDLAHAWCKTGEQRFLDRYIEVWTAWIEAAARGEVRLDPYPTSVRCLNALRSLWLLEEGLPERFADRLLGATHAQLVWLSSNLERHLRANHLLKNLTALTWGWLAFEGSTAGRWQDHAEELWEEVRRQVLPDGGHYERSPMYHAGALDDLLRTASLCSAVEVEVPDDVRDRLVAMTRAYQCLSRPDGSLHLFNDAANGERPDRSVLLALARQILGVDAAEPVGGFAMDATGYFGVIDGATRHRLVIDAGPPGPSHQPAHAHCDMLSFEVDFAGRPVVVDSGLHGYDGDPFREYVRSTRAHNTVAIGGREQHEVWETFRVARRGEILEARCGRRDDGGFEFHGACRHYHDRTAIHRRSIVLRDGELKVTDRVQGAEGDILRSWLHLHPDFCLERTDGRFVATVEENVVDGDGPDLEIVIEPFGVEEVEVLHGQVEPYQGWYCPSFGVARPTSVVEARLRAADDHSFGFMIRCEEA